MIIWGAIVLPLLIAAVLYLIFNHKIALWELGIQIAVPIILTAAAKGCTELSQTDDTEYWGSYIQSAAYFERWNEKVSCRHPIPCSHPIRCTHPEYTTDSKGKRRRTGSYEHSNDGYKHSNDGHYHDFDVDDHDPHWKAYDSRGESYSISDVYYEQLCQQFGNRTFVNLNRKFYTINGNKYETAWQRNWEKVEPITTSHTYENRVQAKNNVFKFPEVNPKDFGLFDYPRINGFSQQCVLGTPGPTAVHGEKKFEYMNAVYGSSNQIRLYVCVFKNQSIQAGLDQESYWKGGNKNEFVTCVGVNDEYEVQWCHVFSWTEVDILKVEAKAFVAEQKTLDLVAYAEWLEPQITTKWQRKHFKDFNYITLDPPFKAVAWTFAITILFSIGLGVWSILNDFDAEHERFTFGLKGMKFHFKEKRKEGVS